jgi:hypothetical protein
VLGDHLDDEAYLKIVRNKILVDIQGDDVLYQIFTSCVLQREAGQEAPFLEFIQRVCSSKKDESTGKCKPIRPGCGGFGIRNFLTLFLSIEVSKAMKDVENAKESGDDAGLAKAQKMVRTFTDQLDESNPILTRISDAMTAEADALEAVGKAANDAAKKSAEADAAKWHAQKAQGQTDLQACSDKYKTMMKAIRTGK